MSSWVVNRIQGIPLCQFYRNHTAPDILQSCCSIPKPCHLENEIEYWVMTKVFISLDADTMAMLMTIQYHHLWRFKSWFNHLESSYWATNRQSLLPFSRQFRCFWLKHAVTVARRGYQCSGRSEEYDTRPALDFNSRGQYGRSECLLYTRMFYVYVSFFYLVHNLKFVIQKSRTQGPC